MNKEIINQLEEKINKDYLSMVIDYEVYEKDYIFNNAYHIAIMQNFLDGFEHYFGCYEDLYNDTKDETLFILSDKTVNAILDYKGNIFYYLKDKYMDFTHPERYNIWFDYDDGLAEVIKIAMEEK